MLAILQTLNSILELKYTVFRLFYSGGMCVCLERFSWSILTERSVCSWSGLLGKYSLPPLRLRPACPSLKFHSLCRINTVKRNPDIFLLIVIMRLIYRTRGWLGGGGTSWQPFRVGFYFIMPGYLLFYVKEKFIFTLS